MSVEIQEVSGKGDLVKFARFPKELYRGSPYWVPPFYNNVPKNFDPKHNAAYEYSRSRQWLALREDRLVGRVAVIHSDGHRQRWNQNYMRFGWIDFIDDIEVAGALLGKVEDWARECGCSAVHGPLGFTDMDQAGMLIEGFNEPATMGTIYNHPYYPVYLESLGYQKDTDWVEYELTVPDKPDEKIARLAQIITRREGLRIVEATNKKDLLKYAGEVFKVFNETYQNLYGFVPLNQRQIEGYTRQYFDFLKPEFVPLVVNNQGKLVAFGITMPSFTRALQKAGGSLYPFGFIHLLRAMNKNDRAELYLIAVTPEYQGKGVNAVLIDQITRVFIQKGIRKVESNPELETNHLVQGQWKHFETRQHKRRRCYIKHLT